MSKRIAKPVQNAIKKDAFDELTFQAVMEAEKISPLCLTPEAQGITQDVFNSLYKMEPQIADNAPMVQRSLVSQMMSLPEFDELRAMTQLDEISSALGLLQFAPKLVEQLEQIQDRVKELTEETGKTPTKLEEVMTEGEMSGLRGSLRRTAEIAQQEAEDWDEASGGWGLQKGELQQMPFEERFALAEELMKSKKLKGIGELAGRFKNIVNSSSAIVPVHGSDEIVDIGQGDSLSHIVPSELLKLRKTPTLFYKDMLEGKLLVYNLKGVENLGKGPIVVCLDISGSMCGPREEWAKAVTLSLQSLTEKQNRAFGFVAFESVVQKSGFWPKGNPPSIKEKIEIAQIMSSGGTSFYAPIMEAFRMRAKDAELKPADIVFITDGDCRLSAEQLVEINQLKKDTEVRIFGIAINDGRNGTDGGTLHGFCDQIAVVNSFGDIEIVKNVIKNTATDQVKKRTA